MKTKKQKPVHIMAKYSNGRWHPLGSFDLRHLPRKGEFIETETKGIAEMFVVVAGIHPAYPAPCSAEVWAVHAGRSSQVHSKLIRENK